MRETPTERSHSFYQEDFGDECAKCDEDTEKQEDETNVGEFCDCREALGEGKGEPQQNGCDLVVESA